MRQEIISVVIPVYNVEMYLERCIRSVLEQSFTHFEVILIDDGSTDRSGEICEEFTKRNQNVRTLHVKNGGASSARNFGIDNAKGKYIVFVDSDDYIDRGMLQALYKEVQNNDIDLCLCGYTQVFADKKIAILPEEGTYNFLNFLELMRYWKADPIIGSPCNKIFNKSIIEKYHIRFKEGMNYAEDYLFNITYFKYVNSIKVIGKSYYNYYMETPKSLTKRNYQNYEVLWENQTLIFSEVRNLLITHQVDVNYHNVLGEIVCYMVAINFGQRLRKCGIIKSTLWIKSLCEDSLIELSLKKTKKISRLRGLNLIYKYIRFFLFFK